MPQQQQTHPAETIAQARQMYAEGARVEDICALTGMAVGTLYYHLDGGALRGPRPPSVPRRRIVIGRRMGESRPRHAVSVQLWRTAARAARDIERRLADPTLAADARAADLRALAQVSRVLRDIAVFEAFGQTAPTVVPRRLSPEEAAAQAAQDEMDARNRQMEFRLALLEFETASEAARMSAPLR